MIAHTVALHYPERVNDLVLIDGSIPVTSQKLSLKTLLGLLPLVGERAYNGLRGYPDKAYGSLAPFYADITKLPDVDRTFLYQRVNERVWSDAQRDAYFSVWRQLPLWMVRHQRVELNLIHGLSVPTTIVWGQDDQIVPLSSGQALARIQPNSHLVVIPYSGHMPHQEQPEAVINSLLTRG
jgi:pimeloyl-ACP methyl ester carboxylesterase